MNPTVKGYVDRQSIYALDTHGSPKMNNSPAPKKKKTMPTGTAGAFLEAAARGRTVGLQKARKTVPVGGFLPEKIGIKIKQNAPGATPQTTE